MLSSTVKLLLGIVATGFCSPAWAQSYVTYTSETAFSAAARATTLVDFNGTAPGFYGRPGLLSVGGVTLTTSGSNLFVQGGNFFGTGNIVTAQLPGSTSTAVQIALPSPSNSFALRYTSGSPTYLLIDGTSLAAPTSPFPTLGFFGVVSDTAFTQLTFGDANDGLDLDEIRFGNNLVAAVPEPATWAMMIAGFGAVGGAMRRRGRAAFA